MRGRLSPVRSAGVRGFDRARWQWCWKQAVYLLLGEHGLVPLQRELGRYFVKTTDAPVLSLPPPCLWVDHTRTWCFRKQGCWLSQQDGKRSKWEALSRVRLCASVDYTGQSTWAGSLSLLQGSSQSRDRTQVSRIAGGFFTSWATREVRGPLMVGLCAVGQLVCTDRKWCIVVQEVEVHSVFRAPLLWRGTYMWRVDCEPGVFRGLHRNLHLTSRVSGPGSWILSSHLARPWTLVPVTLRVWKHLFWRRQWHPTPVLLPGKSHGRRSLVGCSPWSRKESDTTERLHFHFSLSCIGGGNGNPLQRSCLENPRDGGA